MTSILNLNAALDELKELDPAKVQLVELRYSSVARLKKRRSLCCLRQAMDTASAGLHSGTELLNMRSARCPQIGNWLDDCACSVPLPNP